AARLAQVQRVTIPASTTETLYNAESGTGQATAANFSVTGSYELTRQDDAGATVLVRIRFLSQSRNTTPPVPPATTPRVGDLVGPTATIPPGDTRREWAERTMNAAVVHWNRHLTFVGEEAPEGDSAGVAVPKRLPVTFQATPVWTADGEANATVIVHPASVIGGSTGNPIDAGNFYESRNEAVYPAADNVIYAHEYGHLLGIPDEYSQSNRQMHLLLHQASPSGAADAMGALDRVTVERMTLAAVSRPLYAQLSASMPAVAAAFHAQQPVVTTRMTDALKNGVRDPGVATALQTRLEQAAADALRPSVPRIAAFQTTENFSPRLRAIDGVGAELAGPAVTSRVQDAYWTALQSPHATDVAVAGLGDVRVNMSSGVFGLGQGTGPGAAPAAGVAATAVGAASAPGARGLPVIAPPASLVGQLSALPSTWAGAGSAMQAAITPEAVATRLTATLDAANLAGRVAALIPSIVARPRIAQVGALYQEARAIVSNLTSTVARQIVAEVLSSTITPLLQSSVAALQAQIRAEVDRVMTASPGTLAATSTPDPNMVAMVAAMRARLDADRAATSSATSRDPVGAGQAATDQDVTYSYQGLMGSNNSTALRSDQFGPMLTEFNAHCKRARERDFTSETS
ncbi:MAG: hypothetical protein ABIS47_05900, partial [Acidimicrobiales bacterium]